MRVFGGGWAAGIPIVYIGIFILAAIVHIVFAAGVAEDAKRLSLRGQGTFLVGPGMWGFATPVGGVWVAAAYWVIHHCNLRSATPPWEAEGSANQQVHRTP